MTEKRPILGALFYINIFAPPPTPVSVRMELAEYAEKKALIVAELLDATYGAGAGDPARELAALAQDHGPDLAAAERCAESALTALDRLPVRIDPVAPELLMRVTRDNLNSAVTSHIGHLTTLTYLLKQVNAA